MKILLAIDPSIPHEEFLQQITSRTWAPGTQFNVLAVLENPPEEFLVDSEPEVMEQVSSHAVPKVELMASCLRASGLDAQSFVLEGDPHTVIVDEANVLGADLILLGAPRREEGFPYLNSRIARAVLRHAHCSVQIVRTGPVNKVLVPTDGSPGSLEAARVIASRPWQAGTLFEVMTVVEPLSASLWFLYPPHNESEEAERMRADSMKRAQEAIKATEQILSAAGLAISDHVLVPVDVPGKLILQEAANWGADLIVMGSHGRRGIKRLLIGSVSESIAIHANCSVEVIR